MPGTKPQGKRHRHVSCKALCLSLFSASENGFRGKNSYFIQMKGTRGEYFSKVCCTFLGF